jgi:hypothetical protein
MPNSPRFCVFHCSDVLRSKNPNQFEPINRYHKEQGFPKSSLGFYGGYHILVSGGKKYRYREDWEVGAHTNQVIDGVSMNLQSLGLCWAGDGDVEQIPEEDRLLIKEQFEEWREKYPVIAPDRIYPHRKYAPWKSCPGKLIPDNYAQLLIKPPVPEPEKLEKQKELARIQKELNEARTWLERLQDAIYGLLRA